MEETGGQAGASTAAPGITMARFAAASDATWPAATVETLGGWRLRLSDAAAGSRANSAWARDAAGIDLEAAVARVAGFYHGHGRTARMQLWPGDAALDDLLAAEGWEAYDRCTILARPLAGDGIDWPAGGEGTVAVRLEAPLAMAERLWSQGGTGPARQAVFHAAPGAKALFMGRLGMVPAGMVGVILDGEVAVTQALWVAPEARGRGLATTLMAAAGRAAARLGARVMAHAVLADNAPALALYARLGFVGIGRYHYRRCAP